MALVLLVLGLLLMVLPACSDDLGPGPSGDVQCPGDDAANRVLVDASRDGGGWWFPQGGDDTFDPTLWHQGKPLADYLRGFGYVVTELGRGQQMSDSLAHAHRIIIRAGLYWTPYSAAELSAYRDFLSCPTTLVLLSDCQSNTDVTDQVAEFVRVEFFGAYGPEWVTTFGDHPITQGVDSLLSVAGAYAVAKDAGYNPVQFLGWLASGNPIMGVSTARAAKTFFLGDMNLLEFLPQPLLDNLIAWGF